MVTGNVGTADAVQAHLTDTLFKVKNAVEDRDIPRLRSLFAPRPQICVQGRFVSLTEFLGRLEEFFGRVEHISMDIARIEEVDSELEGGFIAARIDFSWIDSRLWEEQTVHGLMALTLAAPKVTRTRRTKTAAEPGAAAGQQEEEDRLIGFSYQALDIGERDEDGLSPVGPRPAEPSGGSYIPGIWF